MLINIIVREGLASRCPKTLGTLTAPGGPASTMRHCKSLLFHAVALAHFQSVRESVPKVSWNNFLEWIDMQAAAEEDTEM